jgi:hypothetical protein
MVTKWRALALVGAGILVAAWSTGTGWFVVAGGLCVAGSAVVAYLGKGRLLLAWSLGAAAIGLPVTGTKLVPSWNTLSHEPFAGRQVPLVLWAGGLLVVGSLLVLAATRWTKAGTIWSVTPDHATLSL